MNVTIDSISYSKSFYKPGEPVKVSVIANLSQPGEPGAETPVSLVATFRSVSQTVGELRQEVRLPAGASRLTFEWQPPLTSPAGYGLDVQFLLGDRVLASASSAVDVLEHWTQNPRYGFLTDYSPDRADIPETMATLTGYHINGLQFYDWMYTHDQFMVDWDPYTDLFGRIHSIKTVNALIEAAHTRNISAMPYTAVYGASYAFFRAHPEWALYNPDGTPHVFIENTMGYMDNRPGSGWTKHLLGQFDQILTKTAFDGIHLDQYGDPKTGYDAQGNAFDLAQPMADMINATKALVDQKRGSDGAVVFNAVTNWPVEKVAPARQDLVYIEVWPPYTWFTNLRQLIVQAQKLGGSKPVVLAAYIDSNLEDNARLMDAIIFASGAGHIALGEKDGYLVHAYFPNYQVLSPELRAVLKRYIEFSIRYQQVFGPSARDVTADYQNRLNIEGVDISQSMAYDKVYPIVRENERYTALNLVNMLGLKHPEWAKKVEPPAVLGAVSVQLRQAGRPVKQVWFASPDSDTIRLRPLAFTVVDGTLNFTLPGLEYWDLVMIEWE